MKITISGTLGSGKSTVAKMLAEKLKYEYYSTGQIMRDMAIKKNISLNDISKIAGKDFSIDKEIDDYQVSIGKEKNNFVLEGRLGFHFVPDSIKIFLKCDEQVAVQRVLKGLKEKDPLRLNEGLKENEESILKNFKERRDSENERYKTLYGITQDDKSNFDLIIDTTSIPPDEVCSKIIEFVKRKQTKKGRKR